MRITSVESTDLFTGTAQRPLQVIRVTLVSDEPQAAPAQVGVHGPGVREAEPFVLIDLVPGAERTVEVPVEIVAPYRPGSTRRVTVTADSQGRTAQAEAGITVAEPGWTMWMVSHFHYDPVWWNTQGQFTEARLALPDEDGQVPDVRSAFELVGVHLDKARRDPDYRFVLAEIDYLKPYFDAFPQDRADLRRLLAEGRVEIVGGNYNEPNTNLISAEAIIRNAVYGIGFQRDVFGGDPRSAWMLDAFGFDPGYPGLMAAAGLTSSAWARGPFHQWGPSGAEGGDQRMQFGTEFEWISPDGQGLLTAYMAHHYGAGWKPLNSPPDLEAAEREAYGQFRGLARVATTRNVLLPVGSDHVIPARWVTDIHRDWNRRYVWPRFTTAVPRDFFDAVRAEASSGHGEAAGAWITPQTRDMNPVYTGKDVSYIDTKQAQRAIETAVAEAERLGTQAWLAGAPFPEAAVDKAWRILAYGAHHDSITGVESDQVYLDLAGSWREAWELASAARRDAVAFLAQGGTGGRAAPPYAGGPGGSSPRTVSVVNGLARTRDGMATVTVPVERSDIRWLEIRDGDGRLVPALADGVRRRDDGTLAEITLTFRARDLPPLGTRSYRLRAADRPDQAAGWHEEPGTAIENDAYLVTADPERGGTVSITDKRTGAAVLAGPGNELVIQDEYAQHPRHGEGPWHLSPKGPGTGSAAAPAAVRRERCPAGERLVASFALDGIEVTQETVLWDGADRVEFRTHVDGYTGRDRLLRVRFPAGVLGALPVYQTATAVIGRSFGAVDVDSADHWYTLDNPAHHWFGAGAVARVRDRSGLSQAIGVAEVISPYPPNGSGGLLRDLLTALAAAGVTATCSQADGTRYGAVDVDSNLPDVRIAVGGPEVNPFTAEVLSAAGPGYAKALAARLAEGPARLWVPAARDRADAFGPDADLRGVADLPVLVIAGDLPAAVAGLIGDLDDAVVDTGDAVADATRPPVPLADRSVALLNRGTPGGVVTPDGTLHMSLMRSCSAWPSGIWIDGDRRNAPDGSSFAWQHWSHTFEYALASGPGDWRAAGFSAEAEDYQHDLLTAAGPGDAGPGAGGLSVEPATVTLSALKPRGNPLASERTRPEAGGEAEVTVRLRETCGRPVTARVRLGGAAPVTAAWLTDLLEEAGGAALPVRDGTVLVDMPAFGTVTAVLRTGARDPGTAAAGTEPVQPVHARYWLHGKGPAPAGNLPVAVHFSPARTAVAGPGETVPLTLTVGCGPEAAAGEVDLVVPAGVTVTPDRELRYDLAPGGYAAWDLAVEVPPGTAAGRYFAAARIRDGLGHLIEDTAMVAVGERRWPDPGLSPEESLEVMLADYVAGTSELDVAVLTPRAEAALGREAELLVRVTSGLASEVHGEAQLISPFGTWEMLGPWTQGFSLAPGAGTVLRFTVRPPLGARPGTWWALVKVMYYGRVRYTEAMAVVTEPVN